MNIKSRIRLMNIKRRMGKLVDRFANKTYAWLVLRIPLGRMNGVAIKSIGGYRIAYRPGTSDDEVLKHSFDNDIFFKGVPEYRPKSGDVVLDVGAHLGDFTFLAAGLVSPGIVYAVEPCKITFDLLNLNIALNRTTNVLARQLALCDRNGTCTLYHSPPGEDWGNSTTYDHAESSEVVPCQTLGSFFDEHGIERVSFAKLNCEGGEFAIILGAPPEVLRRVDIFLVLYHCDFAPSRNEQELVKHLEAVGFKTTIRERDGERGWLIAWQETAAG